MRERLNELILQNKQIIEAGSYKELYAISANSNLFVWQNVFLEMTCVFDADQGFDEDLFYRYFEGLQGSNYKQARLVEEIHLGFVANGLAWLCHRYQAQMSDDVKQAVIEVLTRIAGDLYGDHLVKEWGKDAFRRNAWNHSIVPFSAIGSIGVLLSHETYIQLAIERLALFLRDGVTDAGMTREGLAYCGFVFRNLGICLKLLKESGRFDYSDANQNEYLHKLQKIPEWYLYELFPKGNHFNNLNDSYWNPLPCVRGYLMTFFDLNPEVVQYTWERAVGMQGNQFLGFDKSMRESSLWETALYQSQLAKPTDWRPDYGVFHCESVGYLIDADASGESRLHFNSGKYIGGIHDQSDNNHFSLFLAGLPVAIDSGAANDPTEGAASSTFGHNGVVIDGLGQRPSGSGQGTHGRIVEHSTHQDQTFIVGDASAAYNAQNYNAVSYAFRALCFSKMNHPYLLVFDDIRKDHECHTYEHLLHVPVLPEAVVLNDQGVSFEYGPAGEQKRFKIDCLHPHQSMISVASFKSPHQQPFEDHACIKISSPDTVVGQFMVLIYEEASVVGSSISEAKGNRRQVSIKTPEAEHRYTLGAYQGGKQATYIESASATHSLPSRQSVLKKLTRIWRHLLQSR